MHKQTEDLNFKKLLIPTWSRTCDHMININELSTEHAQSCCNKNRSKWNYRPTNTHLTYTHRKVTVPKTSGEECLNLTEASGYISVINTHLFNYREQRYQPLVKSEGFYWRNNLSPQGGNNLPCETSPLEVQWSSVTFTIKVCSRWTQISCNSSLTSVSGSKNREEQQQQNVSNILYK